MCVMALPVCVVAVWLTKTRRSVWPGCSENCRRKFLELLMGAIYVTIPVRYTWDRFTSNCYSRVTFHTLTFRRRDKWVLGK